MALEWLGLLRILIAVGGTAAATYYDVFNRKNVPDNLLYAFLAVSLIVNIFDPSAFIANLPIAVVFVALMYILYRIGQIGGADVFVIASIYSALPVLGAPLLAPEGQIGFGAGLIAFPSILSVLTSAIVIFALSMVIRYLPEMIKKTIQGKARFSMAQILEALLLMVSYGVFMFIMAQMPMFSQFIVFILGVVFLAALFFILYKDMIIGLMVKWTKNVEPEDVLAIEHIDSKLLQKYSIGRLVDKAQLKRMRKLKRKWPVLDLPAFLPFVLAALVVYVLFGDLLLYGMM